MLEVFPQSCHPEERRITQEARQRLAIMHVELRVLSFDFAQDDKLYEEIICFLNRRIQNPLFNMIHIRSSNYVSKAFNFNTVSFNGINFINCDGVRSVYS